MRFFCRRLSLATKNSALLIGYALERLNMCGTRASTTVSVGGDCAEA